MAGVRGSRGSAVVLVLAGALLAACSSGSEPSTSARAKATTTSTTLSAAGDPAALCSLFGQIAADARAVKATPDSPALFNAEQWKHKIEITKEVVPAVPATLRPNAEIYLELTKDRGELAAAHDYGAVPAEALLEFMAPRREQQAQVEVLLAYVRETCRLP